LRDLDRVVTSLGLRTPNFRMVRDGTPLSPASYSREERKRHGGDLIDPSAVLEHFNAGATIVLEGLHRYWAPLTRFSRSLELELGHRIQVNAYITPPGSQGFAVHRDDHDVFVLQLEGSKKWTVYDEADEDLALIEDEIQEGDALYIPRGFPHAAKTATATSAHLTVGILTHEAIDVVRELMKLLEEEPGFAERLPLRPADDPQRVDEIVRDTVDRFQAWIERSDTAELSWRLRRRWLATHQELSAGGLEQLVRLEELTAASTVRRREGAACFVNPDGDHLRVLLSDRELEMPLHLADAMQFVAGGTSFTVRELEPWLDDAGALVLVKRLVREGLLEVVFDR
jgi:quercetin dioxygenase-like cupin family protein